MGLRLSEAKTQVTHLDRGFDFLGFRIQRRRKRGTNKWYVYTFVADRAIRAVKAKIRAMTPRESHQGLEGLLTWINRVTHGWAGYFMHAVAKHVFNAVDNFVWWRLARLLMTRHRWRWKEFRARHTTPTGRWQTYRAGITEWKRIAKVPVTRYRSPGTGHPVPLPRHPDPHPLDPTTHIDGRSHGAPGASKGARRVRREAVGNGSRAIPAPRPQPTRRECRTTRGLTRSHGVSGLTV